MGNRWHRKGNRWHRKENRWHRKGNRAPFNCARNPFIGAGKRGHYERGLFNGGISRISKFSRTSRKWSDSALFSTLLGFSRISRISKFSRISRKWTFQKRPLFQKTLFSEPDFNYTRSCYGFNCRGSRGSPKQPHFIGLGRT